MLSTEGASVPAARLELSLDEQSLLVFPNYLCPARDQQPALVLGVVLLQRDAGAGIDVKHLAHVRQASGRPVQFPTPWLFDAALVRCVREAGAVEVGGGGVDHRQAGTSCSKRARAQ